MENEKEAIAKRNNLITYVLNNAANKLPMKLSDINKILGKDSKPQQIIVKATQDLKKDYGIILEEIPDTKSGKKFICYAENCTTLIQELNEDQKSQTTLLFIILSFIFMSGGSVYEEQLENFLNGLNIFYNEDHNFFGSNVKKLVTETFVKQLYLKKKKSESEFDSGIKFLLEWGYRAHKEFPKMQLLETAAKIMGKDAQSFQTQYEKAKSEVINDGDDVEMVED